MKRRLRPASAFSLVELTLALGVAAFCLIAVFGLIPVGVQTNRNSTSQTAATNIMASIVADLRGTPKTSGTWTGNSPLFCVSLGTSKTLYFDSQSLCASNLAGSLDCNCAPGSTNLKIRYQATITFPLAGNLTYADIKVTWPPTYVLTSPTPIPSGSVEMFAALNRN
jgi:type II secretory pathway pseudopilin PulG